MRLDVSIDGSTPVGPDGLTFQVPTSARVVLTGRKPYDLDISLEFDDDLQRLVVNELGVKRQAGGDPVRGTELQHVRLADLIERALVSEVLDGRGWPGLVADHPDNDPVAVDALVYTVSYALCGQRPTQTVAEARGLKPGSSIKRVMRAREAGYLGRAHKGRSGI